MTPFRDPNEAANQRLEALVSQEDQRRTAGGAPSRQRRRLLGALALFAAATAFGGLGVAGGVVYALGRPLQKTVLPTNAGTSVTVVFRTDVWFIRATHGGTPLQPLLAPATDLDGTPRPTRALSFLIPDSTGAIDDDELPLEFPVFGFSRPLTVPVHAAAEGIASTRAILDGMPNAWVAFIQGKVYFTTLLAYKFAIKEIRWGIDDGPLDRRVAFAPTKNLATGINPFTDDVYVAIDDAVRKVRVQVVWKDGKTSRVNTIARTP